MGPPMGMGGPIGMPMPGGFPPPGEFDLSDSRGQQLTHRAGMPGMPPPFMQGGRGGRKSSAMHLSDLANL